ncbi:hypothetical protein [Leifsonia sp. NPDC058248]|uniref:hypothetical protein n=1 Tax=Leifsonia sp. NPDC058248 TaxID=3346402 RepID=UPI0036DDE4B3
MSQSDVQRVWDEIDSALREESGLKDLWAQKPDWYGRLLTGLVLAAGDDPISYIDAGVQQGADGMAFRAVIFTERSVVLGTADSRASGPRVKLETRLYARRGLAYLNIAGSASEYSTSADAWPGRVTVHAVFESGVEMTMPAGDITSPEKRARFLELLESLRVDLLR